MCSASVCVSVTNLTDVHSLSFQLDSLVGLYSVQEIRTSLYKIFCLF